MADRQPIICLAVLGLLLTAAAPATGRTWTVERDGSGDFAVIQDAVDAASSGDVIAIGAGRFDEYQEVQGGAHWFDVHVLIPDGMSLTFEGRGAARRHRSSGSDDPYQRHLRDRCLQHWPDGERVVRELQSSRSAYDGCADVADCRLFFGGEATSDTMATGASTQGSIRRWSSLSTGSRCGPRPARSTYWTVNFRGCTIGVYAWSPGQGDVSVLECEFHCDIWIGFIDGTSGRCRVHLRDWSFRSLLQRRFRCELRSQED